MKLTLTTSFRKTNQCDSAQCAYIYNSSPWIRPTSSLQSKKKSLANSDKLPPSVSKNVVVVDVLNMKQISAFLFFKHKSSMLRIGHISLQNFSTKL